MRYHFFLHYGWFFQNLGKEGWRTFMHTTVEGFLGFCPNQFLQKITQIARLLSHERDSRMSGEGS